MLQPAAVKKKYDPNGLFIVRHHVGSEEWSENGHAGLSHRPFQHGSDKS